MIYSYFYIKGEIKMNKCNHQEFVEKARIGPARKIKCDQCGYIYQTWDTIYGWVDNTPNQYGPQDNIKTD
jgi:hypothetical protein